MIDADTVARFHRDLIALAPMPSPARPLALAVSGGPDSMAMLALATAAFPGAVIVATVDHGLRAESAAEAALVATRCATLAVAHATLRPKERLRPGQAEARRVRYDLLSRWTVEQGAYSLATAHHVDDQAETFLMRAGRGSGVGGLAGIRVARTIEVHNRVPTPPGGGIVYAADVDAVSLVRPLLTWRRHSLVEIVNALGWETVIDPSNRDDRYDRTRARALLADAPWLDPALLAGSAAWCAEADADLRAIGDWLWQERRRVPAGVDDPDHQTWIDVAGLPRDLRRRLARGAIDGVRTVNGITRPAFDRHAANIEHLLDALAAGTTATHAGVIAAVHGDVWRFREAPSRRAT